MASIGWDSVVKGGHYDFSVSGGVQYAGAQVLWKTAIKIGLLAADGGRWEFPKGSIVRIHKASVLPKAEPTAKIPDSEPPRAAASQAPNEEQAMATDTATRRRGRPPKDSPNGNGHAASNGKGKGNTPPPDDDRPAPRARQQRIPGTSDPIPEELQTKVDEYASAHRAANKAKSKANTKRDECIELMVKLDIRCVEIDGDHVLMCQAKDQLKIEKKAKSKANKGGAGNGDVSTFEDSE